MTEIGPRRPGRGSTGRGRSGAGPRVPVLPRRLERAAQRRMSRAAWAYVAGSAGQQRTARANLEAFTPVPARAPDAARTSPSATPRSTCSARRLPAPVLLAPVGVLELAHPDADVAVARAAAALGRADGLLDAGVAADGGDRRGARGLARAGSSCTGAATRELVDEPRRGGPRRPAASAIVVTLDTHLLGWRPFDLDLGYLPFARGQGIAQYTSDPVFTRARARARRPGRGRRSSARDRAAARRAPSGPCSRRPAPTPAARWRTCGHPLPRAAVETFLDVFSDPSLTWDDLAFLREPPTCRSSSRGSSTPRTPTLARWRTASTGSSSRTTAGGRSTGRRLARRAAGRWSRPSTAGCPCSSTAASAAAPTSPSRSRSAPTAVLVGRPYVYGLALGRHRRRGRGAREPAGRVRPHARPPRLPEPAELGPDALVSRGTRRGPSSR